jgi:trimeric autotransporter adhesin
MTTNHMKIIMNIIYLGFAAVVLACFCPAARAAGGLHPPPDGDYANRNTAEGKDALFSLTTGAENTAIGFQALFNNTTGRFNTASGAFALFSNVTGFENTAYGVQALGSNTTGMENTAIGLDALFSNATGEANTAVGWAALLNNTTGGANTANGFQALYSNTTGGQNTANGFQALYHNTTGSGNAANGFGALYHNTAGNHNTANGDGALDNNTTGDHNAANGVAALFFNTTGGDNTGNGFWALSSNNTGSSNSALGAFAGFNVITASNVICIGANVAGEDVSDTTWIGNVYGVTTQSGTAAPVIISQNGQLGTVASSRRFKKDIEPMDKISEGILDLKPVIFHYRSDKTNTPQFGLIAEEVAKVNPALVLPDKEGKPYTVRYDQVNAMLLNEFLKENRTVQSQQKEIDALKAELKEQRALIQKVSAQLEMSKPAPQVVKDP